MTNKNHKPNTNTNTKKNNSKNYYNHNKNSGSKYKSQKKPYSKNTNSYKSNKNNTNKGKSNFENTTRIRIDEGRLNDFDSLDTSFLEGRTQNKVKNHKIEKEKILKEKKSRVKELKILRNIFYLLGVLCIVILVVLVLMNNHFFVKNEVVEEPIVIEKAKEKVVDDNYLFVGDFHTVSLDLDGLEFYYPYVKSCDSTTTTQSMLENMKGWIYRYNPSDVFLELGMNDFLNGEEMEEVLSRLEEIILEIQENRPYATVYVESLYPINKEIEDHDPEIDSIEYDDIVTFNKRLKKLTESLEVSYLDVYDALSENGVLKENYTEDGITLTEDGYARLMKVIRKVVDERK